MSSDKDKAQAVDLKNACNQGWETDNCDGLKNTKHTTKAEKEAACKAGQEYRAVNPPDDGSAASGCDDIKTDIVKCTGTSGTNPLIDMILQVINFLAVGVGIAVVGGIIWGGMLYASSNGDSAKAKQGIVVIVNAVLGLLLFIFMYALINYLVPGGLFA